MGTSAHILPRPEVLQPHQSVQIWMPSKHMGNLLISLRTVEALLNLYSGCRCTLVIDEAYRDIMMSTGMSAEIIYFPRRAIERSGIIGKISKTLGFVARIRRRKPVIAIAVEADKVSRRFMPLSGCEFSVGPDDPFCGHLKIRLPLPPAEKHIFHTYSTIADQLSGQELTPGYVKLNANSNSQLEITKLLAAKLADPDKPYAILHPCATKDYKQWPMTSFSRLAENLVEGGLNVVLTGAGNFDGQTIDKLQAMATCPLLSLHNQLSLKQFIALISQARLFVGNDTGPTHLAAACGIPTFAIFGPTDESLWGPLGDNTTILRSDVPCDTSCQRRQCEVGYRCMQTLSPEAVVAKIERCL